jgi:serine/threonine protein kinase
MDGTGKLLGRGNFGQVRQFIMTDSETETETETVTPTDVAVKIMIREPNETDFFNSVYREYEFQSDLSTKTKEHSKYFAKVYNFFQITQGEQYGIVMELLQPKFTQGLELFDLIKAKQLPEKRQLHYCLELARAISATHKMGIVHGDLKPENVAIADGSEMGQLKLVDFGLSFRAGDENANFQNKIDCCQTKYNGTPFYSSYETLQILSSKPRVIVTRGGEETPKHYGASSDWWSYGVMVFEIAAGMGVVDVKHHPCFFGAEEGTDRFQQEIMVFDDVQEYWRDYLEVQGGGIIVTPDKINQYFNNYKERVINLRIKEIEEKEKQDRSCINGLKEELRKLEEAATAEKAEEEKNDSLPTESGQSKSEDEPFGDTLSLTDKQKLHTKMKSKREDIEDAEKKHGVNKPEYDQKIIMYKAELETMQEPTEAVRLLLQLALQFFVKDPKERPFLCLDKPQMEDYDGTTKGERAEALKRIVDELEQIEATQLGVH